MNRERKSTFRWISWLVMAILLGLLMFYSLTTKAICSVNRDDYQLLPPSGPTIIKVLRYSEAQGFVKGSTLKNNDSVDYYINAQQQVLQVGGSVQLNAATQYVNVQQNWFQLFLSDAYTGSLSPAVNMPVTALKVVRMNVLINQSVWGDKKRLLVFLIDPKTQKKYTITDYLEFEKSKEGQMLYPTYTAAMATVMLKKLETQKSSGAIKADMYAKLQSQYQQWQFRGLDTVCDVAMLQVVGKLVKPAYWGNPVSNENVATVSSPAKNTPSQTSVTVDNSNGSIGIQIQESNGFPQVVGVVSNGPAAISGKVAVNDMITGAFVAGNFVTFKDLPLEQVIGYLKGKAGSKITLQLISKQGDVKMVELERRSQPFEPLAANEVPVSGNAETSNSASAENNGGNAEANGSEGSASGGGISQGLNTTSQILNNSLAGNLAARQTTTTPKVGGNHQNPNIFAIGLAPGTGMFSMYGYGTVGFSMDIYVPLDAIEGYDVTYVDFNMILASKTNGFYMGAGYAAYSIAPEGNYSDVVDYEGLSWVAGYNIRMGHFVLGAGAHGLNSSSVRFVLNMGFCF